MQAVVKACVTVNVNERTVLNAKNKKCQCIATIYIYIYIK
jgi:hypothetical protein